MTAYFDDLRREVADFPAEDPANWIQQLGDIERRVVQEVQLVTGDREFPDDLREKILGAIATKTVYDLSDVVTASKDAVAYATCTKCSDLLETLHSLFHQVANRRVQTRFGLLSDSPRAILKSRTSHDRDRAHEQSGVTYLGFSNGTVFVQEPAYAARTPLDPKLKLVNHSPTGFSWGYGGSGPAQLALAILADHFGRFPDRVPELKDRAGFADYALEEQPPTMGRVSWAEWLAVRLHQDFKFKVVAHFLQGAEWALTSVEVDEHLDRLLAKS